MNKYVISALFIFSLLSLCAQEYVFDYEYISTKKGLPDKEVFHIIQDQEGYLWINTPGAISRFDGYTFGNKMYADSTLHISENAALTLAFDQKGNLWYFEQKEEQAFCGIIDVKTDSIYSLAHYTDGQLSSEAITAITPSAVSKGVICITTKTGSVFLFDQSLKKIYQNELNLSLLAAHPLQDGSYWILDEGLAIHYYPNQPDTLRSSLPFQPLKLISQGPETIVEIQEIPARYVQLQMLSNKEVFSPLTPAIEGLQESVKLLIAGAYQLRYSPNLLQLTYKGEELINEPKNLIRPCDNCRLVIHCAMTDVQDNLWLGTQEGIIKFTPIKKTYSQLENGKHIVRIFQWGDTLWVGALTQNIRFNLANAYKKTFLKKERVIASAFALDHQDLLWMVAANQLLAVDQNGKRFKTHLLKGTNSKTIHFEAATRQLFIGSPLGVEVFDVEADTFKAPIKLTDRAAIEVRQIFSGHEGLGITTDQGLFIIDPVSYNIVRQDGKKTGLPTNDLLYAYEEEATTIWLATNREGLLKWNPSTQTVAQFSTKEGLSNACVYAVYEDDFGNLWLPSKNGLNCFNKQTTDNKIYNESDNMRFTPYAHYQSEDGTLYFGGEKGIIKRHPKDIFLKDSTQYAFQIVKVLALPTTSNQFEDRTAQVLNKNKIVITPQDKITEIFYNLMDYRNLYGKSYEYRIEGYQDQWIQTKENKIPLINPPYGAYKLQIRAMGNSQLIAFSENNPTVAFSPPQIEMPIIVKAPIYRQLWFQVLLLVLAGCCLSLISRWRIKALEKDKERLEAEVLKRTQQIEKDKEIIASQADSLKALDKAKTRFFSNITHEYRTPLTLILGRTEQLLATAKDSLDSRKLKSILGSANNLLGLVNQLLDLSKLEGRRMEIEVYHGDLIRYTEELVYRFRPMAAQKKIDLSQTSKRKAWKTYFDKNKWDRIIINLLSNAIKFTPEGGSIKVYIGSTTINKASYISLKVEDTGIGIAAEQLKKIFERFHQVDSSSTKVQQGTGIGLSLVKELVDLQGGTLKVNSEEHKGTTFIVQLPILTATATSKKLEQSSIIIPMLLNDSQNGSKRKKKKKGKLLDLLIIEDNADMRDYIAQCIDNEKYNIVEAVDGAAGIQVAINAIPDLIISDIMMPKKNGFEVVQTLRTTISTSHIPIILLTAKTSLSSKLEGLEKGADAYLTKPFSPEELEMRVFKLIELRQQLQHRYGNGQLNPPLDHSEGFGQEDEFVAAIKEYILANINHPSLNGALIGKNFGMSRMQLHRKLKALTNLPIGDIIRNLRIEKASELLRENKRNMSEIAYRTGFNSPSTFSRIFKEKKGLSPTEFRNKEKV